MSIDKDGNPISELLFAVERLASHPSEMNSIKKHIILIFFNKYTVDGKIIVAKIPVKNFKRYSCAIC